MKIKNKTLTPPSAVKVVIYRDPENFEFTCNPVLDYSEFDRLCPEPLPPLVTKIKTGIQYPDVENKRYLQSREKWADLKRDWLIIQSLKGTEGLEWELVQYDDPSTWSKYKEELDNVLTNHEYSKLINAIFEANNPTEKTLAEAKESFSATQEPDLEDRITQLDEATSTPSGEPANA